MDIKAELLKEHSRQNAMRIAEYVSQDPAGFKLLMDLFFANEYRVTQRASQVVSICSDFHPEFIRPYLKRLILNLRKNVHVAVKRNTVRILQDVDLPDSLLGLG